MKPQSKRKQPELVDPALKAGVATILRRKLEHPDEDRIRQRAYEIHKTRGGGPGHELDDWLQAERELLAEQEHPVAPGERPAAAGDRGDPRPSRETEPPDHERSLVTIGQSTSHSLIATDNILKKERQDSPSTTVTEPKL